jgi:PAS domain S-box-containing protein
MKAPALGPNILEGAPERAFLAAIVDSSDDAIVGKTLDGIVRSWNRGAERIFGYRADEVVGGPVKLLIPPDLHREEDEILERLGRGERIEHYETVRRRKDGTLFDASLTISPIRDDADRVVGASKILRDVTARRLAEAALRESEERFRTLADNIAQFAWMADPSGAVVWYNKRWFDYTGTTFEQMRGWGWQTVHHPEHLGRVVDKFRDCIRRGIVWEDTFPLRGADGAYRWFLSRAIPICDEASGEVVRWFGTNTDITERMAMEAALREAAQRKDEFLATLAHELRNPLAPIRHGLELLRRGGAEGEAAERVSATLERQTEHLVRLVDDLLDVSRITRGKVELRRERVELRRVVDAALELSRPHLDAAGVELTAELPSAPLWLAADPMRLAQVFANLLNNAAHYTPEGGRVRLVAEAVGGEVVVRVADTGAGIPRERLVSIFDLFVQGDDPSSSSKSGLGIGLTLVKALVELHRGRVEATSAGLGQGSEFVISLPGLAAPAAGDEVAEPAAAPAADLGPPAAEGRPLRVLVVDDNRDAADSLRDLLELLGHEAHAAYDGAAALVQGGRFEPDAVLLDLGMPGLDGYETARRLRGEPWGRGVLLIALTGWGQDGDRRRTRDAGFDHHLVKPTDIASLKSLLSQTPPEIGGAPSA